MEILTTIGKYYLIGSAIGLVVFIILLLIDVRQRNFKFLLCKVLPLVLVTSWLGMIINLGAIYTLAKIAWRKRKIKKSLEFKNK